MIQKSPNVEFVGEINEREKADFLANADALIFPIDWREPFGLVMIEAMSCGTPVIAFRRGSVPEVVDDGVSGVLVADIDQAVAAVSQVRRLDRARVRNSFERRFTIERVAFQYMRIYCNLRGIRISPTGRARGPPIVAATDRPELEVQRAR